MNSTWVMVFPKQQAVLEVSECECCEDPRLRERHSQGEYNGAMDRGHQASLQTSSILATFWIISDQPRLPSMTGPQSSFPNVW